MTTQTRQKSNVKKNNNKKKCMVIDNVDEMTCM